MHLFILWNMLMGNMLFIYLFTEKRKFCALVISFDTNVTSKRYLLKTLAYIEQKSDRLDFYVIHVYRIKASFVDQLFWCHWQTAWRYHHCFDNASKYNIHEKIIWEKQVYKNIYIRYIISSDFIDMVINGDRS